MLHFRSGFGREVHKCINPRPRLLQRHHHPQQRGDDAHADQRRANREPAAEAKNADAGEGEDEGGIPEGEVDVANADTESSAVYGPS